MPRVVTCVRCAGFVLRGTCLNCGWERITFRQKMMAADYVARRAREEVTAYHGRHDNTDQRANVVRASFGGWRGPQRFLPAKGDPYRSRPQTMHHAYETSIGTIR